MKKAVKSCLLLKIPFYSNYNFENILYQIITDNNGKIQTDKLLDREKSHLWKYGGIVYDGNELAITGYTTSKNSINSTTKKVYLTKCDLNGNEIVGFPKIFGDSVDLVGIDIIKTNNGFAIVGFSWNINDGNLNVLYLTTDKNGNLNN